VLYNVALLDMMKQMKVDSMNKTLLATAALLSMASASFAQSTTWTLNNSYTQDGSVIKVSSASLLTSATAETDAYVAGVKSCITVDHFTTNASRTTTIKASPLLTGGISVSAVVGVTPTANVGVHTTIAGQTRRVWVRNDYATGATGTTSATITEVTNCQR